MGEFKKALFEKNVVQQFDSPAKVKMLNCAIHGEFKGYVTRICGNKVESICPECIEQEIIEERKIRETEQSLSISKARIKEIFKRSSFPKIFSNVKFDDYKPDCEEAEEVLSRMKQYALNFAKVREVGSSVIFLGGTGTGKSMLSAAVGNSIMGQGYTVLYLTCPQAISLIKRSWVTNSEISQDEYLEKFGKPDLLILDEVPKGCKSQTDWELLHEIMNRRYMEMKPTISISTLSKKQLEEKLTAEVLRRMHFKGLIMHFNWKQYEDIGVLW